MNTSIQRKGGVVLSYISIMINTIVQLLFTPFLIRTLGQSEYGLYSLVASIISYLTVLDLGFGNALIVYTSKYREQGKIEEEKKLHGMFRIVFVIIGLVAALISIILYLNVDNIFGSTMTNYELNKMKIITIILAVNLMMTFSFSIYSSIISAYEEFVFQKIISIIGTILKPILMLPILLLGYKSISMTLILTICNIIVLISNYLFCVNKLKIKIKFNGFDKKLFKVILGYSIWIFLSAIVDKINWSVDNFVLGAVSGTIAVSIYSIAATLNQMFISLSTAISGVLLPKMSKLVANNASSEILTNEMIKVGRLQGYIIFLMCSGLILFGKEFIMFWAGANFEESYYVALLLIVPLCVPLIQNLGLSIMQAMNKYKFKSISTAIMAIFNLIISIFLAKRWGAIGAAFGTCCSLIICNIIIINIYYYKSLHINVLDFWKSIFKQIMPLFIPIIITIIIKNFLYYDTIFCLTLYVLLYSICYAIIAYTMSMNDYEKKTVKNILKVFVKKVNHGTNN